MEPCCFWKFWFWLSKLWLRASRFTDDEVDSSVLSAPSSAGAGDRSTVRSSGTQDRQDQQSAHSSVFSAPSSAGARDRSAVRSSGTQDRQDQQSEARDHQGLHAAPALAAALAVMVSAKRPEPFAAASSAARLARLNAWYHFWRPGHRLRRRIGPGCWRWRRLWRVRSRLWWTRATHTLISSDRHSSYLAKWPAWCSKGSKSRWLLTFAARSVLKCVGLC